MTKLWQKGKSSTLNPAVNRYIISKDLAADNRLIPFDVEASIAHAKMLESVALLSKAEADQIVTKLNLVLELHKKGEFVLTQENEDVHTEIENFLVKELGDVGKRIHVGRSRNDQVLVALRLFCKHELKAVVQACASTANVILNFAKEHEFVPMAGFTHMQHAMPSSVGQWAGSFVESLINDIELLQAALKLNDQNPLGSAAGFGSGVPLNREMTTELLGFSKVQVNPIYCQNSRSKFDAFTINALLQVMLTLGKIANDLVVFTCQEFSFFKVAPELTTGSSIMPQKRNLDIMEVLRANVSIVQSLQFQVQTAGLNLISGYNKDAKLGKKALMDAFGITISSLEIVELLFQNLTPNTEGLARAFGDAEIFAADVANEMVQGGMPFREAYKKVGESLGTLKPQDPVSNIKSKKHLGATGNLGLDRYDQVLSKLIQSLST